MTLSELFTLLNGITGFANKVTYRAWPIGHAPELPFICYMENSSNNFLADDKVYQKRMEVDIELYSSEKDTTSEALIENALDTQCIIWSKSEDYIDTEHCYMITYTITI